MRIYTMLAASAHLLLAACQGGPAGLQLPPPSSGPLSAAPTAQPEQQAGAKPYMRCVTDFWGNCTGVVSTRHAYRWRYVRPGMRPAEERESPVVRASIAASRKDGDRAPSKAEKRTASHKQKASSERQKAASSEKQQEEKQPEAKKATVAARETTPIRDVPAHGRAPTLKLTPVVEKGADPAPSRDTPRNRRTVAARDSTLACHPRRRVIGEERPSEDDARRAAENGWMGAVRYDYGERYQDINRAKDVRHICGPSSVSAALRVPHFRCVVEGTPCRETKGTPTEPDERRYERGGESQISRK